MSQGLRAKTMENVLGGLGPDGGIEGTAFALAADGAFHRAGLEHFGGDLAQQRQVVRGGEDLMQRFREGIAWIEWNPEMFPKK